MFNVTIEKICFNVIEKKYVSIIIEKKRDESASLMRIQIFTFLNGNPYFYFFYLNTFFI